MSWNYRIIKHTEHTGEVWFGIHEVHYEDDKKTVKGWAERATVVIDDPKDDSVIAQLSRAFQEDVIDVSEYENQAL